MKKIPEIIVAVDQLGGFGKEGRIPWNLREDIEHFKAITTGHVCAMGRRTYEELLEGRKVRDASTNTTEPITEILRGRQSYVISSNKTLTTPGATRVDSLGAVIDDMQNDTRKLFVLGGERLFIQALSWANTIHMTIVKGEPYDCDVFFPISVVNKKFIIESGRETDRAYYVVYQRK